MECGMINLSVIYRAEGTNDKDIVPSWRW